MIIDFHQDSGGYTGLGDRGREWRIVVIRTGWRLQFRDVGDATRINAGVYRSLAAAQAEAGRSTDAGIARH